MIIVGVPAIRIITRRQTRRIFSRTGKTQQNTWKGRVLEQRQDSIMTKVHLEDDESRRENAVHTLYAPPGLSSDWGAVKNKRRARFLPMTQTGHFGSGRAQTLDFDLCLTFVAAPRPSGAFALRAPRRPALPSECTLHSGKLINCSPLHPALYIHFLFSYLRQEYRPHSFNTPPPPPPPDPHRCRAYSLRIQINQYLL